jgi:hypothetical protein
MTKSVKSTTHRAPQPRNTALIVAASIVGVLIVLFGGIALALSMQSGKPASNTAPLASPSRTVLPTTTSPTPTGIDPTDLGTTSPTATTSTSAPTTPPQPKPLNTGNGSGCDLGKDFQAQLQTPVSGTNATFQGTSCLKKGQSIWAFNFNMGNSLYFLVSGKSDKFAPIVEKSSVWTWTDKNVDSNTVVNFVIADQTCSDWIAGQDPNNDFNNQIVLNNINQHHCQVVAYQQITAPAGN